MSWDANKLRGKDYMAKDEISEISKLEFPTDCNWHFTFRNLALKIPNLSDRYTLGFETRPWYKSDQTQDEYILDFKSGTVMYGPAQISNIDFKYSRVMIGG